MSFSERLQQLLKRLAEEEHERSVSLYLPLRGNGERREQARIGLKNQLYNAERQLKERGAEKREIDELLKPLREIQEAGVSASRETKSLAFFSAPGFFESLDLPEETGESLSVQGPFHIRPLLPLANVNFQFRLLAISQKEVRLFEGDRYALQQRELPNLPDNIEEALSDDDDNDDQTLQFHTGAAAGGAGERPAMFHGQVVGGEHVKERVLRFCQHVDNALRDAYAEQDVPLLLAAARPVPGIFRQASSYRNLREEIILGDPRPLSLEQLHKRAWEILEPMARTSQQEMLERLHEGLGKERGTTEVSGALRAAQSGRVATLFVPADNSPTNREAGRVSRAQNQDESPESDEALNRTVAEVLRHGGQILTVPPDQLPQGAAVGAIFRY